MYVPCHPSVPQCLFRAPSSENVSDIKEHHPQRQYWFPRPIYLYIYILTSFSVFAGDCMCASKDTLVSGRHNNVFYILHFGQQGDGSLLCHDQSSQGLRPVLQPLQRDFALHHSNTQIIIWKSVLNERMAQRFEPQGRRFTNFHYCYYKRCNAPNGRVVLGCGAVGLGWFVVFLALRYELISLSIYPCGFLSSWPFDTLLRTSLDLNHTINMLIRFMFCHQSNTSFLKKVTNKCLMCGLCALPDLSLLDAPQVLPTKACTSERLSRRPSVQSSPG